MDGGNAEPLLGVTVLESLGIEIDPLNERLTKLSSTRMKATFRMKATLPSSL